MQIIFVILSEAQDLWMAESSAQVLRFAQDDNSMLTMTT